MKRFILFTLAAGLLSTGAAPAANPVVVMETSLGTIKIELNEEKAPISVKNFLTYVDEKFFDGTLFHRIAKNPAVIQGGGYEAGKREPKETKAPIKNEGGNGLSNRRGTIAMARTRAPDSATSQFYINTRNNEFLDRANSPDRVGYAVFGRVIDGMDVVDKIAAVETQRETPAKDVIIKSVRRADK